MPVSRRRSVPTLISTVALAISGLAVLVAPAAYAATPNIQITEFAYGGKFVPGTDTGDGEYVELTNVGDAAQSFAGWSFSVVTTSTKTIDISGFGTVQPGESVLVTDLTPADFRAEWNLKPSVKVITDKQGLATAATLNSGPDTINILNGSTTVESIKYAANYLSAKGVAAWVNPSHLADTDTATAGAWTDPATVGDAEGSWTSSHGSIGSPGASTLGAGTPTSVQNQALAVSGGANQSATVNKPFSFTGLSATGGTSPYTWTAPALAGTGLSIDSATGAITGTPTSVGSINVTATATDGVGASASASFTITVASGIDPNWSNVVINEVTSDNDDNSQLTSRLPAALLAALNTAPSAARDLVEVYNKGDQAVDITGWKQTDSHGPAAATDFSGRVFDVTGAKITSLPAHGFGVFQSGQGLGSGGDAVQIYLPDLTLVDSVAYGDGQAGYSATLDPTAAGPDATEIYHAIARCPDGAGPVNNNTNDTVTAWYSVKNASFGSSDNASCDTSTDPDAAVQKFNQQPPTGLPGTCTPSAPSGSNSVVVPDAVAWPTTDGVHVADTACEFVQPTDPTGNDMSGLVFSADGSVLWGAQNKNHLWKLVKDPTTGTYLPATDNDWGNGKAITFAGSDPTVSQPDSEGLTIGGNGNLFATSERDNHNSSVSTDEVLEYDPTAAGTALAPVHQWDLTSEFVPSVIAASGEDANLGFEGVTYVPDSFLTSQGFRDQHLGKTYDPADYPLHGTGLFFVAFEKNGHVYAYALNSDGTYQRVADIDTGIDGTSAIADVQFNADDQGIWAHCDNDCGVTESLLKINAHGDFTRVATYQRPAGLPDDNFEGFAIAPASTAVAGKREVVWSDDGIYGDGNAWNADKTANVPSPGWGHALYAGTLPLSSAPTAITGTVTSSGQVDVAYTSPALSATGAFPNVVTFDVGSGTLPSGLTLDPATGAISGTPTVGGQYTFTITADNGYGTPAGRSETITIAKVSQSIDFTVADHTYGDPDFDITATASSGLPVTFGVQSGSCSVTGSTVHITGGGTCTITAAQAGSDVYEPVSVDRTFTINRGGQSITFGALPNRTHGDPNFDVSATASSGLQVSFSAAGQCTVSGASVHLTGAGGCSITASQVGDGNFNPASDVVRTFTVSKATQSISFAALAKKTYGSPDFALTATATSGLAVSYAATGTCTVTSGVVHITAVGTCTIAATQPGDANYLPATEVDRSFKIAKGAQSIQFPAIPAVVYGSPDVNPGATATSGLPVTYFVTGGTCTVRNGLIHINSAGSCSITASQSGDSNWLAAQSKSKVLVVNPAATSTVLTTNATVSAGGVLHLVASVSSAASPVTAGSVQFFQGTQLIGQVAVTAGQAVLDVPAPTAPARVKLHATYVGGSGGNWKNSASPTVTVRVV